MNWLSEIFGFFRAFQCWVTIAPWEQGLRVRCGKTAAVLGAGIHYRIPFLDRIFVQATRVRSISGGSQTVSTKDGKALTVVIAIAYSIEDIQALYNSVSHPETTLIQLSEALVAKHISSSAADVVSPKSISDAVLSEMVCGTYGLGNVCINVTSFVYARTYRLMSMEYRDTTTGDNLDPPVK